MKPPPPLSKTLLHSLVNLLYCVCDTVGVGCHGGNYDITS